MGLQAARDVTVKVVEKGSETPVVGAYVVVDRADLREEERSEGPLDDPTSAGPTDADGTVVLRSLPRDEVLYLNALGEGWMWPGTGATTAPMTREDRSVVIRVPPVTEKWWTTTWHDGIAPADGTAVTVVPSRGGVWGWLGNLGWPARKGVVTRGRLVVAGRFVERAFGGALARAVDGRIAFVGTSGGTVHFRPSRRLEVVVHDEQGNPLSGVGVRSTRRTRWDSEKTTDAHGSVTFEEPAEEEIRVGLSPNAEFIEPRRVGVFHAAKTPVDLWSQDRTLDMKVPRRREAVVRCLVDGRPGFPAGLSLRVKETPEGLDGREPFGATWDPAHGEVRFGAFLPDGVGDKDGHRLVADGVAPGYARHVRVFEEETPGGRLVAHLEMDRAGALSVAVNLPRDRKWSPHLQRQAKDGSWEDWYQRLLYADVDAGRVAYENLWPGTFRVVDRSSGVRSETVAVRAGDSTARVHLELSAAESVAIEVVDEHDSFVEGAKVIVEGPDLESQEVSTPEFHHYGDFAMVRIPGDREVTVRVEHETLKPAPDLPSVKLVGGRYVRLRLVPK